MSTIERSFKHFPELPQELRMMVNDDMHPDDRCRFSGASKRCNIEAKSSKNYIDSIYFTFHSVDKIRISEGRSGKITNGSRCYCLEFKKEGGMQYMSYKRLDSTWGWKGLDLKWTNVEKELWREELSNSKTLVEHAVAHFKKQLQLYQKNIKILRITSKIPGHGTIFDAELTNLKNLEVLTVNGNFNGLQFLSRTTRPLKELYIWRGEDIEFPMDKVIRVQDYLFLPDLKLNNKKFLQLSARFVHTNIGELTAEDVYNFIRSWQNGEVEREMREIYWHMRGSSFDTQKLFRLLGDYTYPNEGSDHHELFIKHRKEIGKEAKLVRLGTSLQIIFLNSNEKDTHNEFLLTDYETFLLEK